VLSGDIIPGFADGDSPEEATGNLLRDNDYLAESSFDEVTALELKSEKATVHSLKELVAAKR